MTNVQKRQRRKTPKVKSGCITCKSVEFLLQPS